MYLPYNQKVRMRTEKLRVHIPPLRACPNSLKTPGPVSKRLLHFPKQKAREQASAHGPSECSRPIQWQLALPPSSPKGLREVETPPSAAVPSKTQSCVMGLADQSWTQALNMQCVNTHTHTLQLQLVGGVLPVCLCSNCVPLEARKGLQIPWD